MKKKDVPGFLLTSLTLKCGEFGSVAYSKLSILPLLTKFTLFSLSLPCGGNAPFPP